MAHFNAIVTQIRRGIPSIVITSILCLMFITGYSVNPSVIGQDISPQGQTITFWHPYTDERQVVLDAIIEDFNATNEWDIRVESSSFGNTGLLYDQTLLQLIESNNTSRNHDELPNVIIGFPNEIALYALTDDAIVDLNSYIDDSEWGFSGNQESNFMPSILHLGYDVFQKKQLGLPTRLFAEVMMVNLDALASIGYDTPPISHEELIEMTCAFREQGGWSEGKFGVAQGFLIPLEAEFLIGMDMANGGDIFEENPQPRFNFEASSMQETTSILTKLQEQNCVGAVQSSASAIDTFAAGQSLFYFGSTSTLRLIQDAISLNYATPFEWGVFPMPGATSDRIFTFAPLISIFQHTDEADLASWLFLQWFLSNDIHSQWILATGSLPIYQITNDGINNDFETLPQWEQAQILLNPSSIKTLPALASYGVVRLEIQFALQRILAGASTVEDELSNLQNLSNEILAEFAHSTIDD